MSSSSFLACHGFFEFLAKFESFGLSNVTSWSLLFVWVTPSSHFHTGVLGHFNMAGLQVFHGDLSNYMVAISQMLSSRSKGWKFLVFLCSSVLPAVDGSTRTLSIMASCWLFSSRGCNCVSFKFYAAVVCSLWVKLLIPLHRWLYCCLVVLLSIPSFLPPNALDHTGSFNLHYYFLAFRMR